MTVLLYVVGVFAAFAAVAWVADWAMGAWTQEQEFRRRRALREKYGIAELEEPRKKQRRRPARPIAARASERRR